MDAGRSGRVHPGQTLMEVPQAPLGQLRRQPGPNLGVGFGQGGQPPQQGPVVEHGPPHQQWDPAPAHNGLDCRQGVAAKAGRRITLTGIDKVDQMVGCHGQGGGIGFGGADIQLPIDHSGIDADDLQGQPLDQFHRQSGFARGGGAHQHYHLGTLALCIAH